MPRLNSSSKDLTRRAVVFSLGIPGRTSLLQPGGVVRRSDRHRTGAEGFWNNTDPGGGIHNLWDGLDVYDAGWFQFIADEGYEPEPRAAAFFPAYPVMIRAVAAVPAWIRSPPRRWLPTYRSSQR